MLAVQFPHMQLEVFKMLLIQQVSFGLYIQSLCNLHFTAVIRCDSSVPLLEKQDLVSYCLQKQRSTEEIEMLQAEMLNTLEYFWTCRTKLKHKIQKLLQEDQTDFVRGSISVLYKQYAGMSVPSLHDPPDYQSDDSECSDFDECSDDG